MAQLSASVVAKLVADMMASGRYSAERIPAVQDLLEALEQLGVIGVDRFAGKLLRAVGSLDEFNGFLREGVYARKFATTHLSVEMEPFRSTIKGPDLMLMVRNEVLYVEVKRLLLVDPTGRPPVEVEDWYENQFEAPDEPAGRGGPTEKLLSVVHDAYAQAIPESANMIVITDFSGRSTRAHFAAAVGALQDEISEQGTYRSLGGVMYEPTEFSGAVPIEQDYMLWTNGNAALGIPPGIAETLEAVFKPEPAPPKQWTIEDAIRAGQQSSSMDATSNGSNVPFNVSDQPDGDELPLLEGA